jgi:hypothetical protein
MRSLSAKTQIQVALLYDHVGCKDIIFSQLLRLVQGSCPGNCRGTRAAAASRRDCEVTREGVHYSVRG